MLTLDSLELIGFKSFARKVRVEFDQGVTALVGPNGCGKSNLADAIGWVVGAHTARNVRGQRIEDVIFAGTEKKKASGLAEVRLRFRRNEDKPLVVNGEEFSDEILEVSRKAYRSGEHFYLINQRRCRLLDIQNLFQEAGLGFASYALIAQGKIESFLTAKPLERRVLIEEAAQITGYKSQRRSAELKLEMAEQNLLRVNDIIAEVERQLRSLKRQAAKARRYAKLKDEFRGLQSARFAIELDRLKSQARSVSEAREQFGTAYEELRKRRDDRQQAYSAAKESRKQSSQSLNELQRRHGQLQLETDRCENRIRHQSEQREVTRAFLESNSVDQQMLRENLKKIDDEEELFSLERESLAKESGRFEEAVNRQQALTDSCRARLEEAEGRLDELRTQLIQLSARQAGLDNTSEQLEARHASLTEREAALIQERVVARRQLMAARTGQQEQLSFLETGQQEVERLRSEVEQLAIERRRLDDEQQKLAGESNDLQTTLVALKERLQSIQELELSRSQYSEDVQGVLGLLGSSERIRTGGTLADSLETDPQFERLVEEYLGRELEYILVDSLDDAVGGLAELKTNESGRCTFMTMRTTNGFGKSNGNVSNGSPEKQDGVYGRLADLLEMETGVRDAMFRALPHQASAVVVSDIDRAMGLAHSYPESTFVTLDGEALTPRGLLSVSSKSPRKMGLLAVKRQRRDLEKRIARQQKTAAAAARKLAGARTAFQTLLARLEKTRTDLVQAEKDVIAKSHQSDQQAAELQHHTRTVGRIEETLERVRADLAAVTKRRKVVRTQLQECRAARQESEALLKVNQQSFVELRAETSRGQDELNRIRSDYKVLRERDAALERTLERVSEQRAGLQSRLEVAVRLEVENAERLNRLEECVKQGRDELEGYQREVLLGDERLKAARDEADETVETASQLEKELEALREEEAGLLQDRSELDVEQARCETRLAGLQEQCNEQLSAPLEEVCEAVDREAIDSEQISGLYDELRLKLEKFGPINMTALEEYQEHEERHEFLVAQHADLQSSIADTTQAIREINRRSRRQFQEAFEAINGHFSTVFQKLFGGGECGMQLLDLEDILECGIDVFAQPPGKRLQNIMLLSGGEKTLTVFALLVALFMYRPSRFCVLDEVDAPLDDANVSRFADLVNDLSEQTQFIVITHNKKTMEKANTLFGVTMEEAGVSKVVSVQFE